MELPTTKSVRCLPRTATAKNGIRFDLRLLPAGDGQRLIDMYLAFQPRNSFQGLPPLKDAACVHWVREMLGTGVHIVALDERATLIGHTALFPINAQKCELLVVVCTGFQNVGIGTELVQSCVELATELDFRRIWLPVDATNVRARHVYQKCGFRYVSSTLGREVDMACEIAAPRDGARTSLPGAGGLPLDAPQSLGEALTVVT